MKVGLLIDSLVRGGAERQALYTLMELRRRGIDAWIIYYYRSSLEYEIPPAESARFTFLPKSGRPIRFILRLAQYLRKQRFDIVHAFKDTPCFYGAIAARLSRTPVFVAGHRTQGLPVGKFRHAIGLVNRLCTAWIGNSTAISRSLHEGLGTSPDRLFTVYNGIDPSAFRSSLSPADAKAKFGIRADQPVVSIIAVLRPEKNHPMFVRMAAEVARSRPDTVFLVAGCPVAGDERTQPALEALALELGVASQIRFLGLRPDVPDILAASDVVVLTSHLEGMSNALLECMAAGVPFVSTRYEGVEELVEENRQGLLVNLNDHSAMAAAVLRLIADDRLRRSLGATGRECVERRFSIQAMGDSLLRVYDQLQAQTGGGRRVSKN